MTGLAAQLRDRIRKDGPIPFRDWMEACLYDPQHGYYMGDGPPRTGTDDGSDFATSPTLHPFLARAVAEEAVAVWKALGRPEAFEVVEFGGGQGDLARDGLAWLDETAPALAEAVTWTHVERSPAHRSAQAGSDQRVRHAEAMAKGTEGLVVAHEFVDALPFHWLEQRKGGWAEVHVRIDGDRFVPILGIPSRTAIEAVPKRQLEDGQRVVAMPDAKTWMQAMGNRLRRGGVIVVDYGDLGKHLWTPERSDGTVRGFHRHQLVEDIFRLPGELDITASVDFSQLRMWALDAGFMEGGLESQEAFLVRHGALEALAGAPRDSVEEASAYLRLKQMVLPQGMGHAFKVQRFWKDVEPDDAEDEG